MVLAPREINQHKIKENAENLEQSRQSFVVAHDTQCHKVMVKVFKGTSSFSSVYFVMSKTAKFTKNFLVTPAM